MATGPASKPDTHTNLLHGYQSMLTPNVNPATAPGTPVRPRRR